MIEFKKYNSIENSFNTEYMEKVVAQVPPDMKWVVQEKVHGTNTSFLCDGQDVKFAKRTSRLADDEKFYDYAELFDDEGFFYAKTLFRGSLTECLEHPNAFQSHIAEWLGLPPIKDNICEGVVIRPIEPLFLRNGDRVIIKNKNERFSEKKGEKKRNKLFTEPVPFSETLKLLLVKAETFVNENRLANVISHIGEVQFPKDFGKVMGLFSRDVLEDFLKEHSGEFASLEKCEQKTFNKEVNKFCTTLVKQIYMS